MDTIYYHLNAKKVKVSGGADLVTLIPVAAPGSPEGRGEILDFARCRQRLEGTGGGLDGAVRVGGGDRGERGGGAGLFAAAIRKRACPLPTSLGLPAASFLCKKEKDCKMKNFLLP